jgi:D-beta-D-heptose 7-phosphate kinase/D-beta-D-heptose 1-phosphate adenosyltransferase
MKTVFVNGTFDILHSGHVRLLNTARSMGDYLIVAIDSDDRVAELKGPTRPINHAGERRAMLSNLKAVDEVQIFSSNEELAMLVKQFQPDVMMVGSDWKNKPVIGSEYATRIEYFDRIHEHSTTNIIQRIISRG